MRPPKQLINKWYRLLKESGFSDIEKDEYDLVEYHSSRFNKDPEAFQEKQRYYELANQLLHTFPFSTKINKAIWKLHCGGLGSDKIAEELRIDSEVVIRSIKYVASHIKYENHSAKD